MSLGSSMQIGRSALTASSLAIQVTGNNLANAATPGYSRQIVGLSPTQDGRWGSHFIGRGVSVSGIRRNVDSAIQARLWAGTSNEAAASADLGLLANVETVLNELSDRDLSSELDKFFAAWSELANRPGDPSARALLAQQGRSLTGFVRTLRSDLSALTTQVDAQADAAAARADAVAEQIASLNREIVRSEAGQGQSGALRDQRDGLITELAKLIDVTTVEQSSGAVDVLVGSVPVVLGGVSRGVRLKVTPAESGDGTDITVALRQDNESIAVTGGSLGALLRQRDNLTTQTLGGLDRLAGQLAWEVNRLHSAGYGSSAQQEWSGTLAFSGADADRALNDPDNAALAQLAPQTGPESGSFLVTVTNNATGLSRTVRVNIDLDGRDATGAAGTGDDTSVNDVLSQINAAGNVSATLGADNMVRIAGSAGYSVSFAEDSSGVLATLGINTFFTGTDGGTLDVRAEIAADPTRINAGSTAGGERNDNRVALAIARLGTAPLDGLGGRSITDHWTGETSRVATELDTAKTRAASASLVRENLEAQRASVSGVSVDEEAINLMNYQRQYQGAARFLTVVDELTQTLMQMV